MKSATFRLQKGQGDMTEGYLGVAESNCLACGPARRKFLGRRDNGKFQSSKISAANRFSLPSSFWELVRTIFNEFWVVGM